MYGNLLMMIFVTFYTLVPVLFFEGDCWQFFQSEIHLLPDSWALNTLRAGVRYIRT